MIWRKKMAAKKTETKAVEPPKPVLAVEYNGVLYPSMQTAEGARAQADLMAFLYEECGSSYIGDYYGHGRNAGQKMTIGAVIANAEKVHGILSRYLAAANVSKETEQA
jgi:hypothetical protein